MYTCMCLLIAYFLLPIAGHSPGSYKDHKHTPKAPKSPSKATTPSSETGQHQNPPTPPPVTYTSNPSSSSNNSSGTTSSSSSSLTNGEVVSPQGANQRRDSTQSDDGSVQLLFPPSIDGSARVASTGNDVRDRCRDLIAKALKKGFPEGGGVTPLLFCPLIWLIYVCSQHWGRNKTVQSFVGDRELYPFHWLLLCV